MKLKNKLRLASVSLLLAAQPLLFYSLKGVGKAETIDKNIQMNYSTEERNQYKRMTELEQRLHLTQTENLDYNRIIQNPKCREIRVLTAERNELSSGGQSPLEFLSFLGYVAGIIASLGCYCVSKYTNNESNKGNEK